MMKIALGASLILAGAILVWPEQIKAGETATQQMEAAAPTQGTGFFLGGGIAGTDALGQGYSVPNADPGFPASADKKDSYGGLAEIKVGYDWSIAALDPKLTLGVELDGDGGGQYLDNTASSADPIVNGAKVKTGLAEGLGIVSAKIGYNIGCVRPYIGAGGGGAVLDTLDPKFEGSTGTLKLSNATTFAPAYRGYAGLDLFLSPSWALNVEYRYQVISDVTFASGKAGQINFGDIKSQEIEAGVKFYFR